jgi:hypothetical protein
VLIGLQIGVVPPQSESLTHCTHVLVGLQTSPLGQSALARHCTHEFLVLSQTGVGALHCALLEQVAWQVKFGAQTWFAAHVAWLGRHCTQAPIGLQYGVALAPPSDALQLVFDWHWTHAFALQSGAAAGQSLPDTHCTHLWLDVSHTGVLPPQFALEAQPAMHVRDSASHTGLLAGHWLFVTHCTQLCAV